MLKKVPRDGSEFVLTDAIGSSSYAVLPPRDPNATDMPFQLVPYADAVHRYPTEEFLTYCDEFGYRHTGLAIRVGSTWEVNGPILSPSYTSLASDPVSISANLASVVSRRPIWAFIDAM